MFCATCSWKAWAASGTASLTQAANIAAAQQQADIARLGLQREIGGEQQAREQAIINQAIQDYALSQETPFQRLAGYNALLRGYATPTSTVSQYQAGANPASQLAGLGALAYGVSKKEGGEIKEGIDALALRRVKKGNAK